MTCNKEMIKMIDVLNKLQDKLVSLGEPNLVTELPQIAVIGSQSAGKSSVLESFVGRDFLPRGSDIVTRRPLILQLIQNKKDSRFLAKFNHSAKIFTELDEIRLEIETETDRTVPNCGISRVPINLKIMSPDVLDMNLVDLPGMTKVPVGNQPENIETIIKQLINEYISKDNCLILAVTPANQDLSTSDAIKLAREVDPEGKRTIGVLTKLDRMDRGTNAKDILSNQHKIRLRRGFHGVINRSPKDIENDKSLKEAMADERKFFSKQLAYKDIMHRLGVENLQKYLQKELAQHLFIGLPALREGMEEKLFAMTERIEKIGLEINDMNANDLISLTLELFRQNFHNEIGTGEDVPVDRTNGGANINIKMNFEYPEAIKSIFRDEKRIKREIGLAIMNIFGTRLELFVPNKAFSTVIRQQIELMRMPSIKCVDAVNKELDTLVKNSAKMARFPKLSEIYTHLTLEYLRGCKKRCREYVEHRIDTEKAYINSNNEEFIRTITTEKDSLTIPMSELMVNRKTEDSIISDTIELEGKKYFFSIEDHSLYCFPNRFRTEKLLSVDLKNVQVTCGKTWIVLNIHRLDSVSELKLVFKSRQKVLEWVNAIIDKTEERVLNDQSSGSENVAEKEEYADNDFESIKYPIKMEPQVEEVFKLVVAYISVIEKGLRDILPKLCQKEMIDSIDKFIAVKLRCLVQDKEFKIEELVDIDPMEEERKMLIHQKDLYEEALDTMKGVMKS